MKNLLAIWLLMMGSYAYGEVKAANDIGFEIQQVYQLQGNPEKSYQQFLAIGNWWHADHTWFGKAKHLYIKPELNGCFCEVAGNKQVEHLRVVYVEPNKQIRFSGGLGPLQTMGVQGNLTVNFKEDDKGTKLVLHYQVVGFDKNGLKPLASAVDQVLALQFKRLQTLINKGYL